MLHSPPPCLVHANATRSAEHATPQICSTPNATPVWLDTLAQEHESVGLSDSNQGVAKGSRCDAMALAGRDNVAGPVKARKRSRDSHGARRRYGTPAVERGSRDGGPDAAAQREKPAAHAKNRQLQSWPPGPSPSRRSPPAPRARARSAARAAAPGTGDVVGGLSQVPVEPGDRLPGGGGDVDPAARPAPPRDPLVARAWRPAPRRARRAGQPFWRPLSVSGHNCRWAKGRPEHRRWAANACAKRTSGACRTTPVVGSPIARVLRSGPGRRGPRSFLSGGGVR
jgi:hypothetical protein